MEKCPYNFLGLIAPVATMDWGASSLHNLLPNQRRLQVGKPQRNLGRRTATKEESGKAKTSQAAFGALVLNAERCGGRRLVDENATDPTDCAIRIPGGLLEIQFIH
jgi:hypothetical protein